MDNPRDYDVCVLMKVGQIEVIKNSTEKKVELLLKENGVEIGNNFLVLFDIDKNNVNVRRFDTSNGTIGYRVKILGDQELVYSVKLADFLSYIKEENEWVTSPILIVNKKTRETKLIVDPPVK